MSVYIVYQTSVEFGVSENATVNRSKTVGLIKRTPGHGDSE